MIIFDTETTGLPLPTTVSLTKQPKIIDLALIKLAPVERTVKRKTVLVWEEVDRWQSLFTPGEPLTEEITKITGYTDADLRDAPTFADMFGSLVEFVLGERSMVAHNLPFDRQLLAFELQRLDRLTAFPWPPQQLCTVQLYTEEFGKRPRLIHLYEAKLGRPLDQKHNAMADTEALTEIVLKEALYDLEGWGGLK